MKIRFDSIKQTTRKAAVSILLSAVLPTGLSLFSGEIKVTPKDAVILCPAAAPNKVREGAEELQKHLELITGVKLPIREGNQPDSRAYSLLVGTAEPGAPPLPASEGSRWVIGSRAAYFYGDDSAGRRGSLYAVINFLDEQLGIRWIEPGKDGIVYKKSASLKLKTGRYCPYHIGRNRLTEGAGSAPA